MLIKNCFLVFSFILGANYGFCTDVILDSEESFLEETLEQLNQDPLTWQESLEIFSIRRAIIIPAVFLVGLLFAVIPVGVSCGIDNAVACIITACLMPIPALVIIGSSLVCFLQSWEAHRKINKINSEREKYRFFLHWIKEAGQNNENLDYPFQYTLEITKLSENLLQEFALEAPLYPIKIEDLKVRLLLAVEAGFFLVPEKIVVSDQDKIALKIGQWSSLSPLEVVANLAFPPEELEDFKAFALQNARLIRQAITTHKHYLATESERQRTIEDQRQQRIVAQLLAIHAGD